MLKKGISPERAKQLLGLAKMEDGTPSQYNCRKWAFMIDAPFRIGNNCCNVMKKAPAHNFAKETGKHPLVATMAVESRLRASNWVRHGCNAFDTTHPQSTPMAFWTEQDVLLYIKLNNIKIASVYGNIVVEDNQQLTGQETWSSLGIFDTGLPMLTTTGCKRTGCMFCGFGCHLEKSPNRFELMKKTHPKQYEWLMKPWDKGGLGYKDVIDWINEHGNLDIRY